MDKGIYTALSGGLAKSRELELIANNLANTNTPGFKRDTATFNEYLTELRRQDNVEGLQREIKSQTTLEGRPAGDKSFVEVDGVYTSFRQGTVSPTGRDLDVALEGDGFFEVLTPSGVYYTRAGNFSRSSEGKLVNINGLPILGTGGATGQGPDARTIQLGFGRIEVTEEGLVRQNGNVVAQLAVQEFHEPQWLEKAGNSLFKNTHPDNLKTEAVKTRVHAGNLELSNVNPVQEMTRLIEATRSYESHMQAVKSFQEIDSRTVNDLVR